ncbi:DUF721 domain-containing protein [Patescibacteria group bacterium]|nr:DUF721 domain-containing protein [Patescibacteria group bacterium]
MDKLIDIIGKRLNKHKIGESAHASEVVFKANEYLYKWLKCETEDVRAAKLVNGFLTVNVGNAVWGQEMWNVHSTLLKKLQNDFGKKSVGKIIIKSLTIT